MKSTRVRETPPGTSGINWLLWGILLTLCVQSGCETKSSPANLWDMMLKSSRREDRDFPDGRSQILTQFAHLGHVATKSGILQVVSVRSVLTGMPAPRGQMWIALFTESGEFVGRQDCDRTPLWCEGSRVFLYGVDSHGEPYGNAWDFGEGFESRKLILVKRLGSYMP